MPGLLVRESVRRDGFLATLGARVWRPRAYAAAALADLEAVSGRAAYIGWLRRTGDAWSRLPVPPAAGSAWPLVSVGSDCLDGHSQLAADLGLPPAGATAPADPADEAFLVGAAYVTVVAAGDAAVLAEAVQTLHASPEGPVPTAFVRWCRELAGARASLRRELASWAADRDPETAERAVLAARSLSVELAEALQR